MDTESRLTLHCPTCDARVRFQQEAPLKYVWVCSADTSHEVTGKTLVTKGAK